ncbi:hypothetical protein SRRS_38440 [Sporomusa rhizae]|uniref:hypothetical protein n=1 Tax=Sporomusa rhizae TaxID=357999 RepID=UPI00352BBB42
MEERKMEESEMTNEEITEILKELPTILQEVFREQEENGSVEKDNKTSKTI